MSTSAAQCDGCPFMRACPIKAHVKDGCVAGRHPLATYMSFWVAGILALRAL